MRKPNGSMMIKTKLNPQIVVNYFNELYPKAKCALNYENGFQLVIAVMLSAQAKDERVNQVDAILFDKYQSIVALANASVEDVTTILKPLGIAKRKAKNVIAIANKFLSSNLKEVPNDENFLLSLPGIGLKAKNVILIELFDAQVFPVDTHVYRVSYNLGLRSKKDDPYKCELKLEKYFKDYRYKLLHHQMISFGRNICKAISPRCEICKLKAYCRHFLK